jgi:GTPase SAR1 family protein
VFIGDSAVGKTVFVQHFIQHAPSITAYQMTNACEVSTKTLQFTPMNSVVVKKNYATEKGDRARGNNKSLITDYSVDVFCYDLGGQSLFASLQSSYLTSTNVCFFCFDITNRASFQSIPSQLSLLQHQNQPWFSKRLSTASKRSSESLADFSFAPILILIGLKSDLDEFRKVEAVEAEQFCKKNNFAQYLEWSCRSDSKNEQIEKLFFEIGEKFIQKYENIRKIITHQLE